MEKRGFRSARGDYVAWRDRREAKAAAKASVERRMRTMAATMNRMTDAPGSVIRYDPKHSKPSFAAVNAVMKDAYGIRQSAHGERGVDLSDPVQRLLLAQQRLRAYTPQRTAQLASWYGDYQRSVDQARTRSAGKDTTDSV